jgi:hypothetical protein
MKVTIGELEFSTKQKAYEHVRAVIYDKGECKIDETDTDYEFFTDLVKFKGDQYESFELFKTPATGNTLHLRGVRGDGTSKNISWCDCARRRDTRDNLNSMLDQAMRHAVDQQILDYRYANPDRVCRECEQEGGVQVDHITAFADIKRDFLANETECIESFDQNGFGQWVFKTDNQDFAHRWVTYHKSRATYQFLCQPCHVAKSKIENRRRHALAYASKQVVKNKRKAKSLQKQIEKYKAKIVELEGLINELQVL